jgi:DNA-binding response OmpR family regulator
MRKKILLLLKAGYKFENMLKDYLRRDGFEVDVARNVGEVLYKLKRSPHLLLLIEQDTYEMDCLEIFLNALDIQKNINVMFLGSRDQRNREEIIKLGGIYLDSPVQVEILRGTIKGIARKRGMKVITEDDGPVA